MGNEGILHIQFAKLAGTGLAAIRSLLATLLQHERQSYTNAKDEASSSFYSTFLSTGLQSANRIQTRYNDSPSAPRSLTFMRTEF